MILTPKIRKALRIAAIQHDKQYRKDNVTPFIIHPFEVAMIVSEFTTDEDIICSALLHDVLEDTQGYSYEKLAGEFGEKIANIVQSLTDEPLPNLDWNQKHQKYLENLRDASDEAVLVCLADKYSNVSGAPVNQERVWYYQGVIEIAKSRELTKNIKLLSDFENLVSNNK
ncbi:MAG TPA: HD domain-containing protein [Candidatus Woesebacteria bacterium]|nr:HD domain-containing protein [Candidatus Woesebacteria bacterium]